MNFSSTFGLAAPAWLTRLIKRIRLRLLQIQVHDAYCACNQRRYFELSSRELLLRAEIQEDERGNK